MSKFIKTRKIYLLLTVILAFSVLGFAAFAEATSQAILLNESFENGNKGEFDDERVGSGDSLTYTTAREYEGSYILKAATDTSGDRAAVWKRVYGQTDLHLQCYARWTKLPSVGKRHSIIQLYDNTHSKVARLALENHHGTYKIRVRNGAGGGTIYRSNGISVSTGTWYRFALRVKLGNTDGELEAWFEDVKVINEADLCTVNGPVHMDQHKYGYVYFGICFSKEAHDVYIDSCSISGEDIDAGGGSGNGNGGYVDESVIWGTHSDQSSLSFEDWTKGGGTVRTTPGYSKLSYVDFNGETWVKAKVIDDSYPKRLRAQLSRWGDVGQQADAWYGWTFYVPSSFRTKSFHNWCNIGSLHEGGYGGFYSFHIMPDGMIQIRQRKERPYGSGNFESLHHDTGIPVPRDRAFTVIVHLRATVDGVLDVWLDGTRILHLKGDQRAGSDSTRVGPSILTGVSQGPGNGEHYILFKDVVCATTREKVETWLKG